MPGKSDPADQFQQGWTADVERRLQVLENGQNQKWCDNLGRLMLEIGLLADGTFGLAAYEPVSGVKTLQVGEQADGKYGLQLFDSSNHPRLRIGELPDLNWGLALYAPSNDGTYVELSNFGFGEQDAGTGSSELSTTSTSLAVPSGSPSVNATIGSTGRAKVTVGAVIICSSGSSGVLGYALDGVPVQAVTSGGPNASGITQSFSALQTVLVDGLSPGTHTFELAALSTTGGFVGFTSCTIGVQTY